MKTMRSVAELVLWLAIVALAAILGSLATGPALPDWYERLRKPWFSPPNWLFGPVWTVLYVMMAVSAWLVMRRAGQMVVAPALFLFLVQLAVNAGWSLVFFGLHSPGHALVVLIALWLLIVATIAVFWRVSAWAGGLLLPYLAWVSFAGVLNWAIWRLNM